MIDTAVHFSGAAARWRRLAALVERSFRQAATADDTRRTLSELPDNLLKDLGIVRSEIPFAAAAFASCEIERGAGRPREANGGAKLGAFRKMAERVGFEPTIRFPVYTLSKRAP